MQVFEFNTDKMTWEKNAATSASYNCTGLIIKFTDEAYFQETKKIFESFSHNRGRMILVDHTNGDSFILDLQKISRYDVISNKWKSGTNKDNFAIDCLIRYHTGYFTDINNYWLYVVYE